MVLCNLVARQGHDISHLPRSIEYQPLSLRAVLFIHRHEQGRYHPYSSSISTAPAHRARMRARETSSLPLYRLAGCLPAAPRRTCAYLPYRATTLLRRLSTRMSTRAPPLHARGARLRRAAARLAAAGRAAMSSSRRKRAHESSSSGGGPPPWRALFGCRRAGAPPHRRLLSRACAIANISRARARARSTGRSRASPPRTCSTRAPAFFF